MHLPVLGVLRDCSNWSLTVQPFLPQLHALPFRLLAVRSLDDLQQLYVSTNPLISAFALSVALGLVFLIVSEVNRNYSQVDRMWSLLPNLYIVHLAVWARLAGLPHRRIDLVAASTTLWSCRLTFNYWRKGGYRVGSEDYRWAIVKAKVPSVVFFVFNVTFISFIQSVLLFAFSCAPAYAILLSSRFEPDITAVDLAYFTIEIVLVVSEWFSDGQQWSKPFVLDPFIVVRCFVFVDHWRSNNWLDYQAAKSKYNKDAKLPQGFRQADLDRGFITSGLWAYSRRPNFFAEQGIWFMLYQWSCFATNSLYNWTFVGSASLMLLFQGSTWLTELITAGKYPEYAEYQRQVSMFMPCSLQGYKPPSDNPRVVGTETQKKKKK